MCGIIGRIELGKDQKGLKDFPSCVKRLSHRGPDHHQYLVEQPIALGHTRLSIIDLDERSHQPMTDTTGRYTLVYNGEVYNYRELRQECEQLGYAFRTESDTEVLLVLLIHFGEQALNKLNGFFAFAFFDREEKSILLARDRYGIKPLVYYMADETFAFSSELKALMAMKLEQVIDKVSLFTYFKFNYIPAPHTILQGYRKLEPGHRLKITWSNGKIQCEDKLWYDAPYDPNEEKDLNVHDYKQAQKVLKRFLRESVKRRLVADVPVGTFLSGGIDSSIITSIASEEKKDIEAFSLAFPDQRYFDESEHARAVAKHLGVGHHVFEVRGNDLLESADEVLEHMDEPFADASALNVYLLSKHTRKHVKVALSGDGGDELFAGYHKHGAEFRLHNPKLTEHFVGNMQWLWDRLPSSRNGSFSNLVRQLQKFSDGYHLGPRDRYWRWAGILTEEEANYFLRERFLPRDQRLSDEGHAYKKRKDYLLRNIRKQGTLNEVLLSDLQMVLPNDMLYKVDSMSMAHALEVRTPMLDHHVVKHAFRMPVMFKVNHGMKKKILQDSYRDVLPAQVFDRKKKGFEVPLQAWFKGPMRSKFEAICDDRDFIEAQGLINYDAVRDLKKKLYSSDPGDAASSAWALYVFQSWYKKYME